MKKRATSTAAAVAALTLWGSVTRVEAAPAVAQLGKPQVRLWYQVTGRLSNDIAPPKRVNLWNTVIGEGDAQERADDALFTVEIRTSRRRSAARDLVMVATNDSGKILAKRTFRSVTTSRSGTAVLPLWVAGIGCAGKVNFSASFGSERRSFSINFPCGE